MKNDKLKISYLAGCFSCLWSSCRKKSPIDKALTAHISVAQLRSIVVGYIGPLGEHPLDEKLQCSNPPDIFEYFTGDISNRYSNT